MRETERRSFLGRMSALVAVLPMALALNQARAKTSRSNRPDARVSGDERLQAMEKQMEQMAARLGVLEDAQAVRRLQHAYGYYLDKCLYEEVVELFSEDGAVQLGGAVYRGRAGQRRFYQGLLAQSAGSKSRGPVYGLLLDTLQLQDIVDVAPDRRSAKARLRCFVQGGAHDTKKDTSPGLPRQWWEGAICENAYAKGDDGIWRIRLLNYRMVYRASYEEGWAHTKMAVAESPAKTYPEDPLGPDQIESAGLSSWPDAPVVPFHYAHPVTGKPWT